MDKQTYREMEEWTKTDKSYLRQKLLEIDGPIDRQTDGKTDRWMNRQMDEWTDGQTERWTKRQTEKWTKRQTVRWTNEQREGQKIFINKRYLHS
jgi:hypothetical protein